jgi:branched-chain amino acid transport system permease protein
VIPYLVNGLGLGAVYAFIALGYTMVYGIIQLINFAHGEFVMVGAFAGWFVLATLDLDALALPQPLPILVSFFVALLAASLAAGTLAVVVERLAYRPVRKAGRIAALLTAVGVSLLLQNLAIRLGGAAPRAYPEPRVFHEVDALPAVAPANLYVVARDDATDDAEPALVVREGQPIDQAARERMRTTGEGRPYHVQSLPREAKQGFVLLALAVWAPVLWFLVKRTRMGKAMRAVSQDMSAAALMGIPIDRVVAATFFLGGVVGGVGGVAYCATYGSVDPLMGFLPGLKAFVAAVLGGIGSIPGAILGGLLLGVIESVVPYLLREAGWHDAFAWKDVVAFALLIVVLLVRPWGLLGRPIREKV